MASSLGNSTLSECWLCLSISPANFRDPQKLKLQVRCLPHTYNSVRILLLTFLPLTAPEALTVTVERVNGTHIEVTWEKLSLADARGDVLSYSILYSPVTIQREDNAVVVPGNKSSVLIGGLDPQQTYTVQVWATTAAGDGMKSVPVEVLPPRIANPPGTGNVLCQNCAPGSVTSFTDTYIFPQDLVLEWLLVLL